jgi:hypothetical protein
VNSARILFFGLTAIYLVAVLVQFFLAGLATFDTPDWDLHRGLGIALVIASLVLIVVALVGRLPRRVVLTTVLLFGLNVLQMILANIDVDELAAFHPVNAVAIAFIASVLMQRSRIYLASKMAA